MSSELRQYRFAMGSEADPCSAVWRIWTQGNEAYVSVRTASSVAKLSLHANGNWQFRIDTKVSSWQRPKPFRPGWTHGPTILIPHNDLPVHRPYYELNRSSKVNWLPQPRVGMMAQIELLFAGPAASFGEWRPAKEEGNLELEVLTLRGTGRLYVVRFDRELLPKEVERMREHRQILRSKSFSDGTLYGISGFTIASDEHGRPLMVELQHERFSAGVAGRSTKDPNRTTSG